MFLDRTKACKLSIDNNLFPVQNAFLHTKINQFKLQFLNIYALFSNQGKITLSLEKKIAHTGSAKRATIFIEIASHISHSTSRIIGSSFNYNSDTMRSIPLVNQFLIIGSVL